MNRAVYLDRDGVLNEAIVRDGKALAPLAPGEFVLRAEAPGQVRRLKAAGFLAIVFTNQPEVGRGNLTWESVHRMHRTLSEQVPVDAILICPHVAGDGCGCRKPLPGMLLEGAAKHQVDLSRSFVIGDRWRDIDAGRAAGCYSILLERDYSACSTADARVADLKAAVDIVLARTSAKEELA